MVRLRGNQHGSSLPRPASQGLTLTRFVPALGICPGARRRSALLRLAEHSHTRRHVLLPVRHPRREGAVERIRGGGPERRSRSWAGVYVRRANDPVRICQDRAGRAGSLLPRGCGNPGDLRAQAAQCRWLAKSTSDERTTRILLQMANKYEERAGLLDPHPDEAPVIILKPE